MDSQKCIRHQFRRSPVAGVELNGGENNLQLSSFSLASGKELGQGLRWTKDEKGCRADGDSFMLSIR